MSYGSLFQITGPAYEKDLWPKVFVLTEGTKNAVVTGRTELSQWCINPQDPGQIFRTGNSLQTVAKPQCGPFKHGETSCMIFDTLLVTEIKNYPTKGLNSVELTSYVQEGTQQQIPEYCLRYLLPGMQAKQTRYKPDGGGERERGFTSVFPPIGQNTFYAGGSFQLSFFLSFFVLSFFSVFLIFSSSLFNILLFF